MDVDATLDFLAACLFFINFGFEIVFAALAVAGMAAASVLALGTAILIVKAPGH